MDLFSSVLYFIANNLEIESIDNTALFIILFNFEEQFIKLFSCKIGTLQPLISHCWA